MQLQSGQATITLTAVFNKAQARVTVLIRDINGRSECSEHQNYPEAKSVISLEKYMYYTPEGHSTNKINAIETLDEVNTLIEQSLKDDRDAILTSLKTASIRLIY